MKKYFLLGLIPIFALLILWTTFPFYEKLSGFGLIELNHFLKRNISSQVIFAILMKPYAYFSLVVLQNFIPIFIFFLLGLILSKLTEKFWLAAGILILLMILNIPKLLFDAAVVIGINFSFLNILSWLTSSFSFPLWGILGYYFGEKYPSRFNLAD